MGSLQVRLFVTYLVIIGVTLGLAALSLFLLLGGYRDSISYGNLEDLGRLIDSQANTEIRNAAQRGASQTPANPSNPSSPSTPPASGADLVLTLRTFLDNRETDSGTSVAVVDKNGRILPGLSSSRNVNLEGATVKDLQLTDDPSATGVRRPQRCTVNAQGSEPLLCVSMPISQSVLDAFPGSDAAALIVAKPAASLGEVFGDLVPRLLFSGLIGVAAALFLGFLLSQSVAAPLRNIARAARSVARGNYRQRVPVTGPTEVRDLASNFNRMTEEVQRSQQTLRDFLANISHELKTPLTSIRGFSQAMLDGTIDDTDGIQRSARVISDESNRVLRLVEELLDLSRIESGQAPMRLETVNLHELLDHVGEVFALRAEEAGVRLELNPRGVTRVQGDFDRLEQVLNNLLDNAFRHTPPGGTVRLTSREVQPGLIQVTVADTGQGISPESLPHLFDRFYRANGSSGSKGYGLGLAITREVIRAHGGDIWVTSEEGRGTTFVFTLPTADRVGRPGLRAARAIRGERLKAKG